MARCCTISLLSCCIADVTGSRAASGQHEAGKVEVRVGMADDHVVPVELGFEPLKMTVVLILRRC